MDEVSKGEGVGLDKCASCAFKANLIQYCIDNNIGPFHKFLPSYPRFNEIQVPIYLSLLQVILVTLFLFVTLSAVNGPFPVGFNTLLYIVLSVVASYVVIHLLLVHYNKPNMKDVKNKFAVAYLCDSSEHESLIMNEGQSITHILQGKKHSVIPFKLELSTTSFSREASNLPFFLGASLLILEVIGIFVDNEILREINLGIFLTFVLSLVVLRFLPRRKNDTDLVKPYVLCVPNKIAFASFSFYKISGLAMKRLTKNIDIAKLCYVPDPRDEKKKIYLIEAVSYGLLERIRGIKFSEDNEQLQIQHITQLVTPRSLSKWNALFSDNQKKGNKK